MDDSMLEGKGKRIVEPTNENGAFDADPLIKMAVSHHEFESIHPFYDGDGRTGRTGRIVDVLYLVNKGLLDIPVLTLSSQLRLGKPDYYHLLQAVLEHADSAAVWQAWVLNMLAAVETTAQQTSRSVTDIKAALLTAGREPDSLIRKASLSRQPTPDKAGRATSGSRAKPLSATAH